MLFVSDNPGLGQLRAYTLAPSTAIPLDLSVTVMVTDSST